MLNDELGGEIYDIKNHDEDETRDEAWRRILEVEI